METHRDSQHVPANIVTAAKDRSSGEDCQRKHREVTGEKYLKGQDSKQNTPQPLADSDQNLSQPIANSSSIQPTDASLTASNASSMATSSAPLPLRVINITTSTRNFSLANAALASLMPTPMTGILTPDPTSPNVLNTTVWIPEIELNEPDNTVFAAIEFHRIAAAEIFALTRKNILIRGLRYRGATVTLIDRQAAQTLITSVRNHGLWIRGMKSERICWDTIHFPPPPYTNDSRVIELLGPENLFGLNDVQQILRTVLNFDPVETTQSGTLPGGQKIIQLHYSSIPYAQVVFDYLNKIIAFSNLQHVFTLRYGSDPCGSPRILPARNMG